MPIAVQCSGCGGKFRAPNEAAGKRVKCPKCSASIMVSSTRDPQSAQPPPREKKPSPMPPAVPARGAAISDKSGNSWGALAWAWGAGGTITVLLVVGLLWFFNTNKLPKDGSPMATTGTVPSTTPTSIEKGTPDAGPVHAANATAGEAASTTPAREKSRLPDAPVSNVAPRVMGERVEYGSDDGKGTWPYRLEECWIDSTVVYSTYEPTQPGVTLHVKYQRIAPPDNGDSKNVRLGVRVIFMRGVKDKDRLPAVESAGPMPMQPRKVGGIDWFCFGGALYDRDGKIESGAEMYIEPPSDAPFPADTGDVSVPLIGSKVDPISGGMPLFGEGMTVVHLAALAQNPRGPGIERRQLSDSMALRVNFPAASTDRVNRDEGTRVSESRDTTSAKGTLTGRTGAGRQIVGKVVDWGEKSDTRHPYRLSKTWVEYRGGTKLHVDYEHVGGAEIEQGDWDLYLRVFFFPGLKDFGQVPGVRGGATTRSIEAQTVDGVIWCPVVCDLIEETNKSKKGLELLFSAPKEIGPYSKSGGHAWCPLVGRAEKGLQTSIPLFGDGIVVVQLARLQRGEVNLKVLSDTMALPVSLPAASGDTPTHITPNASGNTQQPKATALPQPSDAEKREFWRALANGDRATVRRIVSTRSIASLLKEKSGPTKGSILHSAVSFGWQDIVERIVAQGADVNQVDNLHWTPLIWAVAGKNQEIAELLIAHGANVNHADFQGDTPLAKAVRMKQSGMAEMLRKHGAKH